LTIERIDSDLCNGCGICVESCPMDVIGIDDSTSKAVIQYPDDCTLCQWCQLDCPQNAIAISPCKDTPLLTSWG
jgi:NAD-dependent dihydropyrimidine dehydrogenase PreA subunit